MRYTLEIVRSAGKEIEGVRRLAVRRTIVARIAALADDPRPPGCTRLAAREAYRVRQGDYRILYTVADEVRVVRVIRVAHRRDAYR
jgi:mRNA interferase RelE/StbE